MIITAKIKYDSSNSGVIMRLYEEGIIIALSLAERAEQNDPREFVKNVRSGNLKSNGHHRGVIPATDAVVTIMQRQPNDVHNREDIATALTEFDLQSQTASGTLSDLKNMGYVSRVSPSHYMLTEKGKLWKQDDHIARVKR